jgi:hypothetical protein
MVDRFIHHKIIVTWRGIMEFDYKELSELKTEISVIKERQKEIDERLIELLTQNKTMTDELKAYREKANIPNKELMLTLFRLSAIVVTSLFASLMSIILMQ